MPQNEVIPVFGYPDVGEAIRWLCDTFGFTLRWRAGDHRAQLNVGDGAIAVTHVAPKKGARSHNPEAPSHSVMVRIENVDAHHTRARRQGARILQPPTDFPYGERQYTVEDLGGYIWTFSESIADVEPEAWGGVSGHL